MSKLVADKTPEEREKVRARDAAHYEANREKILAKQARYRAENREKDLARKAKYREENREKVRVYTAAYYRANRERVIARVVAWQAANPEKVQEYRERAQYRYATDILYRVPIQLRRRMSRGAALQERLERKLEALNEQLDTLLVGVDPVLRESIMRAIEGDETA